jgi:hypothetical protein
MSDLLVHVVLIKFRPAALQHVRDELYEELRRLPELCGGKGSGIVYWKSDWNLDQRKDYHLMEFALFESQQAFNTFHAHPAHRSFAEKLSNVADWVVGDLGADSAELARALSGA